MAIATPAVVPFSRGRHIDDHGPCSFFIRVTCGRGGAESRVPRSQTHAISDVPNGSAVRPAAEFGWGIPLVALLIVCYLGVKAFSIAVMWFTVTFSRPRRKAGMHQGPLSGHRAVIDQDQDRSNAMSAVGLSPAAGSGGKKAVLIPTLVSGSIVGKSQTFPDLLR